MINLFKNEKPKRATRVARVENLNPEKNIYSSLQVSKDGKRTTVCLCLADRTTKTTFLSYADACAQMKKYRILYSAK